MLNKQLNYLILLLLLQLWLLLMLLLVNISYSYKTNKRIFLGCTLLLYFFLLLYIHFFSSL